MAGVLPQTNCTLLEVLSYGPLTDSFSDSFAGSGSGEGPETESKWSGSVGAFMPAEDNTLESSTDGRDELKTRAVLFPLVCSLAIGDKLRVEQEGVEKLFKVSGFRRIGQGIEVKAGQFYRAEIEVS